MLNSLLDLMKTRLRIADRKVPVDEVFFHRDDRRLRYLAVDIGGWFEVNEVIVAADLLDPPGEGHDHWSLRLDEQSLERAPRWSEHAAMGADLTGWPPIIVGPFGGTYAPILMYEQMVARSQETEPSPEEAGRGDDLVYRMERATEWIGLPAFGEDGELGTVEDILFDDSSLTLETLILGSGGLFSHVRAEAPLSKMRHMAAQGTHLVLDMHRADLVSRDEPDG
jgi:hypothetical protein